MAIKIIDKKWVPSSVPGDCKNMTTTYITDTDADFAKLPKCYPGSTAVSAATGNVMVVNASGQWVDFLKSAGE